MLIPGVTTTATAYTNIPIGDDVTPFVPTRGGGFCSTEQLDYGDQSCDA